MAVTQNVSSSSLNGLWDWSQWSLSGTPQQAMSLLDEAADLLVLDRNFAGALELCERGLQFAVAEPDVKCEQVKASLCVVGIQALAEMERWREVLSWLLQYYRTPQELPNNIMELCLLLHSKVKQPGVMLELSSDWLGERANQQLPGYGRVAELHLLSVLLPLGLFSEAEELARDPRGFTVQQQQVVLKAVAEGRNRWEQEDDQVKSESRQTESESEAKKHTGNTQAKLRNYARLLCWALGFVGSRLRRLPLRQIALAILLVCLILLRLDPASPVSQGPVSRLLLLLRRGISDAFRTSPGSYH
ncbi:peroxisome assembly protein 26 isoform X2 [Ascaphus truei]|uniref:peroxisome assembly protein 26 isoform X2 n=1 Tax=Ascaphus truei TaxID=8439 RepID=UPI003F59A527